MEMGEQASYETTTEHIDNDDEDEHEFAWEYDAETSTVPWRDDNCTHCGRTYKAAIQSGRQPFWIMLPHLNKRVSAVVCCHRCMRLAVRMALKSEMRWHGVPYNQIDYEYSFKDLNDDANAKKNCTHIEKDQ
jgi:hypothetical protein